METSDINMQQSKTSQELSSIPWYSLNDSAKAYYS